MTNRSELPTKTPSEVDTESSEMLPSGEIVESHSISPSRLDYVLGTIMVVLSVASFLLLVQLLVTVSLL